MASENHENFGNINMKYIYELSCCMLHGLQNIGNSSFESSSRYNRNNNINAINCSCLQQHKRRGRQRYKPKLMPPSTRYHLLASPRANTAQRPQKKEKLRDVEGRQLPACVS
jgi:hypothetical protein